MARDMRKEITALRAKCERLENELKKRNTFGICVALTSAFNAYQIEEAQRHWRNIPGDLQLHFWRHYTTGAGKGYYESVSVETGFVDFLVLVMIADQAEERQAGQEVAV